MADDVDMAKRQRVLADLGEIALRSEDLGEVLTEVCRLAGEALGAHRAAILEIGEGGDDLLVRANVGGSPDAVGRRLPMREARCEASALRDGRPVAGRGLRDGGAGAPLSVPILLPGRRPYGILQVDAPTPRAFTDAEAEFLRICALALGPVVDRLMMVHKLRDAEMRERERESRFRTIFDAAPVGLSVIGRDGRFIRVNQELARILGRPVEALVGAAIADVTHEADVEASVTAFRRSLATGETVALDKHYRRPDGGLVPANSSLTPLRTFDGPWAILVVTVDLSERQRAEQALRRSEERYRALVTAGTYSVYRMSPDWRLMYQLDSDTLANTTAPIEDWVPKYILDEDLPRVFAAIDRAIGTKSLFELEHRVRMADGSVGWVLSRAVPLLGADGEIREWFGAGSDISERRLTQERLRAAEERHRIELEHRVEEATTELKASHDLLQATMDASTDMIQVFEAVRDAAGRIADFRWVLNNRTSELWYGDVRGESLLTRNPGVVAEGIFDAFCRVTETGVPEQAERHYVHEQFDGWFYQTVVGLNDGVATTTKDISDWKSAQAEVLQLQEQAAAARLRDSEERLRQFGEASSDILWIRDVETLRWTYLTPAFEQIYGLAREEALTGDDVRKWTDLIDPDDREEVLAQLRRVAAGERVTFEFRIRRPADGELRWLRNTDFPIRDESGAIVAIGGIGHDITAEKEASSRLEVLFAELQHRTRNLIGVVRAMSDRTADGADDLPDFLVRFRARLGALARINTLLSKLDSGERVTFDTLLRNELEARGFAVEGRSASLVLDGPAGVRLRSATVQTLALAIHELATNAVKYGALSDRGGHLAVTWRLQSGERDRKRLRVEWTETGVSDMPGDGAQTQGGGYGRMLIEQALPYQLGASTTYELRPDGVRCTIDLPLKSNDGRVDP